MKMKYMYDFILFENSGLRNHCFDLVVIAKMLRDVGYSVAIADVTREGEECKESGFPIIKVQSKYISHKTKDKYMRDVINEICPLANNFYVGSILSRLSWLSYFPKEKVIFVWSLRTFFLTEYMRFDIKHFHLSNIINSLYNRFIALRLPNIRFFVSNEIIRQEHEKIGFDFQKIVIRQERFCTEKCPVKQKSSNTLSLLTIGSLRDEKKVDFCIKAFDELNDPDVIYVIAGKAYSTNGYDIKLERLCKEKSYIRRLPNRLSDIQFNQLINDCDYLVLCDKKQPSSVTNGTLAEALLSGHPIIAPNYEPYKSIIEKYHVGILYEMDNVNSFNEAVIRAKNVTFEDYSYGINKYQEELLYDNILKKFKTEIDLCLKK